MLSLAGIPPTAGFMGQVLHLSRAHRIASSCAGHLRRALSRSAVYYYFRVIVHAWLKKPGDAAAPFMSNAQAIALGAALL